MPDIFFGFGFLEKGEVMSEEGGGVRKRLSYKQGRRWDCELRAFKWSLERSGLTRIGKCEAALGWLWLNRPGMGLITNIGEV